MASRFLVVPQWQGSGSSRAMRLADGANAISGDLPAAATTPVEVRVEAGEPIGTGVLRASSIIAVKRQVEDVLATFDPEETVIAIGGDCGADLAPAQQAIARHPEGSLALVWFDAHGDLNTPDSSPSGTFSGMVLRALLGQGAEPFTKGADGAPVALRPSLAVLAGARELDEAETRFIETDGVHHVSVEELATPDALVATVAATRASAVYVHVDLDVLDPSVIEGVGSPEPFGLEIDQLTAAIRALRERFAFAGGAVTSFAPASPEAAADDLGAILRVLGALTRPLPADRPTA